MPRFLNTSTGEFEEHNDPALIRYAILSHTWRQKEAGGEQSYQDVRKLQMEVEAAKEGIPEGGPNSVTYVTVLDHPQLSDKIRGICEVARDDGYELVWNDACCIDKTSSAELSEAINSMYDLYRLAQICYVYLEDVLDGEDPERWSRAFRKSRWFTRGWTLQELLAPGHVTFLSRTWNLIGTKWSLAPALEEVTRVDISVLVGRKAVDSCSVYQRMSWAARRETTRVEDRAYSLLGIFGVHMSPIYGEGNNAFIRLQEEIIRAIPDQSVFAWGRWRELSFSTDQGWTCSSPEEALVAYEGSLEDDTCGLLAPSLDEFSPSNSHRRVAPIDVASFASRINKPAEVVPSLHCIFTPEGVRVQLFCIDLSGLPELAAAIVRGCDECVQHGFAHALALLQCETVGGGTIVGLLLRKNAPGARGLEIRSHNRCRLEWHHSARVLSLAATALNELLPYLSEEPLSVTLLRSSTNTACLFPPYNLDGMPHIPGKAFRRLCDSEITTSRISPDSQRHLGVLGFALQPLQLRLRKGRLLLLETALISPSTSPSRSEHGLTGEATPQTLVKIKITIRLPTRQEFRWPNDCMIIFVIAYPDGLPRHPLGGEQISTSNPEPRMATRSIATLGIPKIAPGPGVAAWDWSKGFNHVSTSRMEDFTAGKASHNAVAVIRTDSASTSTSISTIRLLRLGISCLPSGAPGGGDKDTLVVSAELSQKLSSERAAGAGLLTGALTGAIGE
ncbi:heterokaryon incompatibility protein-domain-containing protein [Trametes polyzona]|nr:heterokaryon incompatibility protein-domain-containing protein [Trametes polyzona]